jgi:hypothetical protein
MRNGISAASDMKSKRQKPPETTLILSYQELVV